MQVQEVFRSWQGEGPNAGCRALFIRFTGCPIKCDWCDTKRAWGKEQGEKKSVQDIIDIVESSKIIRHGGRIIFTGGEPALVKTYDWKVMIQRLAILESQYFGMTFKGEVETAGIRFEPTWTLPFFDTINVSPKRKWYEQKGESYIRVIRKFVRAGANLKFVVGEAEDFNFAQHVVGETYLRPSKVWLMPRGTTLKEMRKSMVFVTELAKLRGFSISDRMQIVLGLDGNRRLGTR